MANIARTRGARERRTVPMASLSDEMGENTPLGATRAVLRGGIRFHDLRHTAGTLAARTGATTKEIMARLGHSSPRASMMYQHAAEDRDRLIAERLAAMAADAGVGTVLPFRPRAEPQQDDRASTAESDDAGG